MPLRPLLDLNYVTIDPALIERIPHMIALYYLALPLACEEHQVSVAMAHPENQLALARLQEMLEMDVVPVRGAPEAIRTVLQRCQPKESLPAPKILVWSRQPVLSHEMAGWASFFGSNNPPHVSILTAPDADLETVLTTVRKDRYSLTVVQRPESNTQELLSRSATPVVLMRDEIRPLRRILVVMRGFSSDEYVLDWIAPLIRQTGAAVTLMPLVDPTYGHLHQMLNGKGLLWEHVEGCLRRFGLNGLYPHLKLREGKLIQQIVVEVEEGNYDLLVIPAEGYGEFVTSVLAEVNQGSHGAQCPVLVMKPTWSW
jgi:nucleotide-binding universal stress UspA family protein